MSIDLEKLASELKAAGVPAGFGDDPGLDVYGEDEDEAFTVWLNGRWLVHPVADPLPIWWRALDIIRRYVSPPPPGPAGTRSGVGGTEVRELVAKTAYEAFFDSSWSRGERSAETECWRNVADAVLAVLGLAGDREGVTGGLD